MVNNLVFRWPNLYLLMVYIWGYTTQLIPNDMYIYIYGDEMISHTKDWIPPLEMENIYKESISSSSI